MTDEDKLAAEWAAMEAKGNDYFHPRVLDQDMIDSLLGFDEVEAPDYFEFETNIPGYIISSGTIRFRPMQELSSWRFKNNSFTYGNIEALLKR